MKLTGVKKFLDRLKGLTGPRQAERITQALYQIGRKIELTAELSITAGSITGKGHVVSAPGQPPNADTRNLDGNIETRIIPGKNPRVVVESLAPYSAALEYGTSKMAARPFMRPAVEKHRRDVVKLNGISINVK